MYGDRRSIEFMNGMHYFIGVAEANKQNGFMYFLCGVYQNKKDYSSSNILHSHLPWSDFMSDYNGWTKHGERGVIMEDYEEEEDNDEDEEEALDETIDDLGRTIVDAQRL
jgi:hypothetical protein